MFYKTAPNAQNSNKYNEVLKMQTNYKQDDDIA